MSAPRVCVVGSYVHAFTISVPRMPGGGETVIGSGADVGPGGKGSNQAVQAARLGAGVAMVACVGDDAFGRAARELWDAEGVDAALVRTEPSVPTGMAFVILERDGQNRIVVDVGANAALSAGDARRAEAAIAAADVVMAQFEPPVEAVVEAFAIARRHGVRTLLNPAPARPVSSELLALVDVLVPNLSEAEALAGPGDGGFDVEAAAAALRAQGPGVVVVTLEERGAYLLDGAGGRRVPGVEVDVVDSTGAGDAFCGALAVALGRGDAIDDAVALANRAGAFCVTRGGVVPGLGSEHDLAGL